MNSNFKIIPAIDIIDGKCVRLTQGDYSTQKTYSDDPLEMAKRFEGAGIQYMHLVDLDGAKSKKIVNQKVLSTITKNTNLKVDFGGGIKSDGDIKIAFDSGAQQVTCGSIAVSNPTQVKEWISEYGSDKIILGADCKSGNIATHGWTQQSDISVIPFIQKYEKEGIQNVICTDISKDGLLKGTSIDLYTQILHSTNLDLIASGGISSIQDIVDTRAIGCAGVIIGKAIYEGYISLSQLSELC